MRVKLLFTSFMLCFIVALNGQENTAILCADGIDNDGDGLVDCQDPDCQTFPTQGCPTCFEDGLSFADYIIDYSPECPDHLTPQYMVATDALGVPDNDPTDGTPGGLGAGRVTLGEGGSITVGFSNNLVTNTGNNDPDVWVFEVGSDVEGTLLDFRPFDAATLAILTANGIPDADGDGFYEFGAIGGSTAFIDLDAVIGGLAFGDIKFDAIKLTDILDNNCVMPTSGADIDGICALSSLPQEVCGNGVDDDGDGLIDCDDDDLIGTCCCLDPEEIDLGPDLEICEGESVLLDAGSGFVSYEWQNGDTSQTFLAMLEQEYIVFAMDTCMNVVADTLLVTFLPNVNTEIDLFICEGDSVEYNGVFYSMSGTYEQTLEGTNGCDTLVSITVDENPSFSILFNFEICEGDTVSLNETNYTEEGSYEQNLVTEFGCDSTLLIDIEVLPPLFELVELEGCEGDTIIFMGMEFTESGSFEFVVESNDECDRTFEVTVVLDPILVEQQSYSICDGSSIDINNQTYDQAGDYIQNFVGSNGCDSIVEITIAVLENAKDTIEYRLCNGGEVTVNGEVYTQSGIYEQTLIAENGCDSLLIIDVSLSEVVLNYDFDDCQATIVDGANANYSEFESKEITELDCGTIEAFNVYREDPEINIHSCTPGVNDSPAMCVSSVNDCVLEEESTKAVVFEVTISPKSGESIGISCFNFYEKAPAVFEWLGGASGPNNFPGLYDLTILKNGAVIFNQTDNPTEQEWNQESYDFSGDPAFNVLNTSTFTFRLTPYCQTDNGSTVSAWDIDEISISAQCGGENRIIAGRIMTEEGIGVSDVLVSNESPEIDLFEDFMTTDDGGFTFENIPLTHDYTVVAERDSDFMEGVSTLDLLLIQKHILGLKKLDSPYKLIAADISNDQNISALDLIQLRKLILGVDEEFSNNTSWRFVAMDSEISMENPWIFNEEFFFENLSENKASQNMTAVKIGDVNGSINSLIGNFTSEVRSSKAVQLNIKNRLIKSGERSFVSFNLTKEMELSGLQIMLETKGIKIINIQSTLPNFNASHFNIKNQEARIAWTDMDSSIKIEKNDPLMVFEIMALEDIWLNESIQVSIQRNSEFYSQNATEISPMELRFLDENEKEIEVFQNQPNPFADQTIIGFNLDHPNTVQLSIINLDGKIIYSDKQYFDAGMQQFVIDSEKLNRSKGVLFYQVEFEGMKIIKRMIKL